jgi:hypothetical protein
MRVLVLADGKSIHDDSDPENILSGITAFELACVEKVNGISRYGHVQIRMWNLEFGVELPPSEVVAIIKQYGG